MTLIKHAAPWGPGTEYPTYDQYWEYEVIEKLMIRHYFLTILNQDTTTENV